MPFIPCLSFGDDVGAREAEDNWEKVQGEPQAVCQVIVRGVERLETFVYGWWVAGVQKVDIRSIQDTRQLWFGQKIWITNLDISSWAKGPGSSY